MYGVPTTVALQPREARRAFRLQRRTLRSIIATVPADDNNRLSELAKVYRDKMAIYESYEEQRKTKINAITPPHLQATSKYPLVNVYLDSLTSSEFSLLPPPKSIHNGPYLVSGKTSASNTAAVTSSKNITNHAKFKASKKAVSCSCVATTIAGITASSIKKSVPDTASTSLKTTNPMISTTLPSSTGDQPAAPSRQPLSSGAYYLYPDHGGREQKSEKAEKDDLATTTVSVASHHHFQRPSQPGNEDCSPSSDSVQLDAYDSASEGFASADLNTSETVQHHPIIPGFVHTNRNATTAETATTNIPAVSHFGEQWINTQRIFNYAERETLWSYPSADISASAEPTTSLSSPSIHDSPFLSYIRRRHSQGNTFNNNHNFFCQSGMGHSIDSISSHHYLPPLDSYSAEPFAIDSTLSQNQQQQRYRETWNNSRSGSADINYRAIHSHHSGFPSNANVIYHNNSDTQDGNYQDFLESFDGVLSENSRKGNTIPFFDTSLPSPYMDPYVDSPHTVSESPINSAFIYLGEGGNNNTNEATDINSEQRLNQTNEQSSLLLSEEGSTNNNTNSSNSLLQSDSPTSLMDSYRAIPQETINTSPLYNTSHGTSFFQISMNKKEKGTKNINN